MLRIAQKEAYSLKFTFHYGSTSIKHLQFFAVVLFYLHSTMVLLLLGLTMPRRISYPYIYIPLWFYFYPCTLKVSRDSSVIYIPLWFYFYDEVNIAINSYITIYIPLWFYFYVITHNGCVFGSHIYIPLWFYFYKTGALNSVSAWQFTFHYGSTSITSCLVTSAMPFLIYIPLWFYFYSFTAIHISMSILIYIPLWFYFYNHTIRQLLSME